MVDQENVVINRVQESWVEKRLLKELGRVASTSQKFFRFYILWRNIGPSSVGCNCSPLCTSKVFLTN